MAEIWDCFLFNDELDLLEARLAELEDAVDHFVIVEGDRTHRGDPKPLHFASNRARFERWSGKISHVVAELDPALPSAWDRESQHRRWLGDAIEGSARGDDLVMVSDVDEIPDRDAFPYLLKHEGPPVRLQQQHAIYFANWVMPRPWTNSTFVFHADQFGDAMVRQVMGREHEDWTDYREIQLADAGVHVSFLGGVGPIQRKLSAYAHQEFNDERVKSTLHLERCMDYGVHFEGRDQLRRLRPDELSPLLRRLSERPQSAAFFDFRPTTLSPFRARAYCAYAWLRTRWTSAPAGLLRFIDRNRLVTGAGAPLFWVFDLGLRMRRRMRPSDDPVRGIVEQRGARWLTPIVERWR
jgi:hypothetical protein